MEIVLQDVPPSGRTVSVDAHQTYDWTKNMLPLWFSISGIPSNKQGYGKEQIEKGESKVGMIISQELCYFTVPGHVAVLNPIIDKISLIYKMDDGDPDLKRAIIECLLQEVDENAAYKSAKKFKSGAVKYAASVNLMIPPNGEKVLIQVGPKKAGMKHDLRLEFNPNRLGPAGIAFLKSQLETLLVGALNPEHIFSTARVTRLDIAVDLVGIRMDQLLVEVKKGGKSHWYYSSRGHAETAYLGMKPSGTNAPWVAYNKRNQLKELSKKNQPGANEQLFGGLSHTRIEYSARPQKGLAKLKSISNPFDKISVACPVAPDGVQYHEWQFFLAGCQIYGINGALALLPQASVKKCYTNALDAAQSAFWKPAKIWAAWDKVLASSGLIEEG